MVIVLVTDRGPIKATKMKVLEDTVLLKISVKYFFKLNFHPNLITEMSSPSKISLESTLTHVFLAVGDHMCIALNRDTHESK